MKLNLKKNLGKITLGLATFVGGNALANHSMDRLGPDTTISFESHRARLTDESKAKLDHLIADAKSTGKIEEVQIAVWSDNPAPVEDKSLSKDDRRLADKRKEALASYLKKGLGVADVDSYNMAERANWLARAFNTDDAKLKSEINNEEPMSKDAFRVFKDNGNPSKAVVLVVLKK